jgi:deazaflavin-dependent oxidoreductase (nitroreductase family)
MVALFRLGLGRGVNGWPSVGGRILVLVHVGRKTGIRRRTPLNYATVDGDVYCTAGFGSSSDWYRNILAHPEVEIWLPDGWWAGSATDISGSDNRIDLLRKVLVASGFAAWLAGIRPKTDSDQKLALRPRSTGCPDPEEPRAHRPRRTGRPRLGLAARDADPAFDHAS